ATFGHAALLGHHRIVRVAASLAHGLFTTLCHDLPTGLIAVGVGLQFQGEDLGAITRWGADAFAIGVHLIVLGVRVTIIAAVADVGHQIWAIESDYRSAFTIAIGVHLIVLGVRVTIIAAVA